MYVHIYSTSNLTEDGIYTGILHTTVSTLSRVPTAGTPHREVSIDAFSTDGIMGYLWRRRVTM